MSINSYEEYRTAAKVRKLDYDAVPGTSSGSNRSPGQFLKDGDHLKTLIKTFPFVNPNYLKNHVLNAFKDENERGQLTKAMLQNIVASIGECDLRVVDHTIWKWVFSYFSF